MSDNACKPQCPASQSAPIVPLGRIFSILANSHSLLHSGQAERVFSHRWMQSRWKTWPQTPHAMLSPGCSGSPVGLACRQISSARQLHDKPLVGRFGREEPCQSMPGDEERQMSPTFESLIAIFCLQALSIFIMRSFPKRRPKR